MDDAVMDDAMQCSAEAYKHVPRHMLQPVNAAAACLPPSTGASSIDSREK